MSYGELILAASADNSFFNKNPEITFFKSVFKRHTNFAIETLPVYFNNTPDFGCKLTAIISSNADLLSKLNLHIELPSLNVSNHTSLPYGKKKIKWSNKIGLVLLSYVDLEIGGVVIDRLYSDWLNIWYELTNNNESINGYNKLIGNVSELNSYTNGKDKYTINIPLIFWFCQDYSLALPLISLKNHEIKIHVQLNNFSSCIKESPTNYFSVDNLVCLFEDNEIIEQEIDGIKAKGEFVYFDIEKQRVYYNNILGSFKVPTSSNSLYKITGKTSSFEMTPTVNSTIESDEKYFYYGNPIIENAFLEANFIFLDKKEKMIFLNSELHYLVPKVRFTLQKLCYNTNSSIKISSFCHPSKIIFWRPLLKLNSLNNDFYNYTTYPLTDTEEDIIKKNNIIINSTQINNLNSNEYYDYVENYKNKFNNTQKGIYKYSFSLNPKEYQPSGSLNLSKVNDPYIEFTLNSVVNYQYPVYIVVYSLIYNVFTSVNGYGGLKFYK